MRNEFPDDLIQELPTEPKEQESAQPEREENAQNGFAPVSLPDGEAAEGDRDNEKGGNDEKQDEENSLSFSATVFDWVKSFVFSLAAVIFIFTLIFRGVTVVGDSMRPTLHENDYLIISDLFYTPKTGDIVVVQAPHYKNGTEPIIKRVIAVGGQTVGIRFDTWQVFVDGVELSEDYILKEEGVFMAIEDMQPDENAYVEFVVDENCVFVMGDNRNNSLDSRSEQIGKLDERYIIGRVIIRLLPFDSFGKVA